MKFKATPISYRATGLFSSLVNDYLEAQGTAQSYVEYNATLDGYKKAIEQRASFPTNRKVLVEVLQNQYTQLAKDINDANALNNKEAFKLVNDNVSLLLKENTFTVTTAHQPNIFTGPLYFIYKIIHAIQLAAELKKQFPKNNFVPVYYMGSEDADLQEVGAYNLAGKLTSGIQSRKGL